MSHASEQIVEQLRSMFQGLDSELIHEVLISFDGDIDQTIEALIKISEESSQKSALDDDYNRNSNSHHSEHSESEDSIEHDKYNEMIAEMMQAQFDLEYEEVLQKAIEESIQKGEEVFQDKKPCLNQRLQPVIKDQLVGKPKLMSRVKGIFSKRKELKEEQISQDEIEELEKEGNSKELSQDDEEVISFEYPESNSYSRGGFIPRAREDEMILKY
jgi:hypothetical protein